MQQVECFILLLTGTLCLGSEQYISSGAAQGTGRGLCCLGERSPWQTLLGLPDRALLV